MSNESLEGFLLQKIQAYKNSNNELEAKITKAAGPFIEAQKANDKEIARLQALINDFKKGVNPLVVKTTGRKGGRTKK